jgi:hypothetical protein
VFVGEAVSVAGWRVSGGNGDKVAGCSKEVDAASLGEMVVGVACPQASRKDPRVTAPTPTAATLRKFRLEYLPMMISFPTVRETTTLNQDGFFFSEPVLRVIPGFVFPPLFPVGFFTVLF